MFKYNFSEYSQHYVHTSIFKADALVLSQVDENVDVLEVGCASGYMSKYMKEVLHCQVTWVEYSQEAWENAKKYQRNTYIWNLDTEDFLLSISWKFDVIIFPAVLEHLRYPQKVLDTLLSHLKPGGKVIISLPNIAHFSMRIRLFFGMFNYTKYGIMDDTHLRFYTYKTMKELVESQGLNIIKFYASFPFPWGNILEKIPIINKIIYFLVNRLFFRLLGEEIIFVCKKEKW